MSVETIDTRPDSPEEMSLPSQMIEPLIQEFPVLREPFDRLRNSKEPFPFFRVSYRDIIAGFKVIYPPQNNGRFNEALQCVLATAVVENTHLSANDKGFMIELYFQSPVAQ